MSSTDAHGSVVADDDRPRTPVERQRFDGSALETAKAYADQVTGETRHALGRLLRGRGERTTDRP